MTLARKDLTPRALGAMVRKFCTQELNQSVTLNNLALIYDARGKEEVVYRINLNEGRSHRGAALQLVGRIKI